MISLLILIILAWAFYIGYSRGIVLQGFYSLGAILALTLAGTYFRNYSQILSLWIPYSSPAEGTTVAFYPANQLFQLDQVFYAGLSYLLVFTLVYAAFRLLGIFAHLLPSFLEDKLWANIVSGFLSLLVTAFVLQMLLIILSTVPLDLIQNRLNGGLARLMIEAPLTSDFLKSLWFSQIV